MAKFVILNFDETDRFRLTTEKPELSLASSTFNPARPGVFFLSEDSEAVFIQLIGLNPVKDLGHDAASALAKFVESGGSVVSFIGPSDQAELGKLIGPFPELHFQPNSLPESVVFSPDEPFQAVFEQFQMSISHAYKLLPAAKAGDAWEGSPKLSRPATILAKSSDGCPVALLLPHGRGSYVLLPWFGTNNIDVVSTLISAAEKKPAPAPEIAPPAKPKPVEEAPKAAVAPALAELEPAIKEIRRSIQEPAAHPAVKHEPAFEASPQAAAAPALVEFEPLITEIRRSALQTEAHPETKPEPVAADISKGEVAPSPPDLASVIVGITKSAPEAEAPQPKAEAAPPAAGEQAPAPTAPQVPSPVPEPELVPPPRPEPVREEAPQVVVASEPAKLASAIAGIARMAPEAGIQQPKAEAAAPAAVEPAATEAPATSPVPSSVVLAAALPEVPIPTPKTDIILPPMPEPVRGEPAQVAVAPVPAELASAIAGIARIAPETEIPQPMVEAAAPAASEPVPVEAPASPPAPSPVRLAPDLREVPSPAPEPENIPSPMPEPVVEEPPPALGDVFEPAPEAEVAPTPQAPDRISLPSIPDLVAGGEETAWLEQEEYAFPELREIHAKREEETQRYARARHEIEEQHARAMQEIDERLRAFKASGQEAFLNLLRSEGRELVQAVIFTLQYLGWTKVIDVHDYWKKVIRAREEEIWVLESESPSVEAGLMRDKLFLVVVRSGKAGATDDECALLQRFKGRRMQEYSNTQMKALLIGNYFLATEGRERTSPFSPQQAEEAAKDGNALLSTYDLFQAVKAEKEGRVTKDELRRVLQEKYGLIQFSL